MENEQTKMRPGRRRDRLWEHVKEVSPGRFKCNHCKESYNGSGSRIRSHLYGIKGGGIRPCRYSPFIRKNKAQSHDFVSISKSMEMIPSSSDDNTTRSPSFVDSNLKKDVDNLILEFLSLNHLPLETVEQPCFRNLLDAVARAGTTYELPTSGFAVFTDSLPFEEKVMQYIHNVCSSIKRHGCTIVIHPGGYFSKNNRFSIYTPEGVICTAPFEKKIPKESITLQLFSKIEDSLKEVADQILLFDDFKIGAHKEVFVYGNDEYCCATKCIIEHLNDMLDQCKYLVNNPFSLERNALVNKRHEKDGRQICTYPLSGVLQDILQNASEFWPLFGDLDILEALRPLIRMLFVFDNYVPNIGYFYGAILKAKSRLKRDYDRNRERFRVPWALFVQCEKKVLRKRHLVAAYLNPGFMFYQRSDLPNDIHDDLLTTLISKSEKDLEGYLSHDTKCKEEVDAYEKKHKSIFTDEAISMLHTYHPVNWWKEFGSFVPKLRRLAINTLSMRVNSLSHPNHRLRFNYLSDDIFSVNAIMMEEFGKWKQENDIFTPIDLNILDAPIIK